MTNKKAKQLQQRFMQSLNGKYEADLSNKFYEIVGAYGNPADDELCQHVADLVDNFLGTRDSKGYPVKIQHLLWQYVLIWECCNPDFKRPAAPPGSKRQRSLFE